MKKRNRTGIYPIFVMGVLLMFTISWTRDNKKTNNNLATIEDIDGNVYHTVTIGTQIWMVENLKVNHYRNGDYIPYVADNTKWSNLSTGAYCNYDHLQSNSTIYGKLYNWYAVSDGRKIAPNGWHIPTDAEWAILINYLGGNSAAGNKLSEEGKYHWQGLNKGATNESGFAAFPGGGRGDVGIFNDLGIFGDWWSFTASNEDNAYSQSLDGNNGIVHRLNSSKPNGYSVRCLKD